MRFILAKACLLAALSATSVNAGISSSSSSWKQPRHEQQPQLLFRKDVQNPALRNQSKQLREAAIQKDLLAVATPLNEYRNNDPVSAHITTPSRRVQEDDYYMGDDEMFSFSGYALKYAKCQPMQYFDDQAIEAGLSSPMSKVDIVMLRLCPQASCDSNTQYGCFYNYGEYAVDLNDYLTIMLKYSAQKRDYLCDFCDECLENNNNNEERTRRLDEEGQEEEGEEENNEDQQEEENQDGEEEQEENQEEGQEDEQDQGGEDEQQEGENNDDADAYANACADWNTYCYDYDNVCAEQEGGDDNNNNNQYLDYEEYLDYLDCTQADYNGYAYFIRPRCDGGTGAIKMAVYYDQYCTQYAGSDVSVKDLGLGFKESAFSEYYDGSCMDCSEGDYPFYDSNSLMCNNMHNKGASCTGRMQYDLFANEDDESTECSFIESLRFGTYDKYGQLNTMYGGGNADTEVTDVQKGLIALAIVLCCLFIIYACYLHHSMTNLLIKSLSHRELLPPSRHSSRNRGRTTTKETPAGVEQGEVA